MPVELPADLLRPIIAHVAQNKDLYSLALVSASFRQEAQQALFKTTVIIIDGSKHPLLDAVIASPNRLALMIKRATIHVHLAADEGTPDYGGSRGEAYARWSEEAGPQTRKALKLMNQLKSLRISCSDGNDRWHCQLRPWMESLLEGCALRLKALDWEVMRFNLPNLVSKNLANQPDIVFLSICCQYWDIDVSEMKAALVKFGTGLHTLSATWEVICSALENGAIIPHLQVIGQPEYTLLPTAVLRKALGRVESLRCSVFIQDLGVGIEDLKNIALLEVQWLSEEDCARIYAVAKLKILILLYNWDSWVQSSEVMEKMVENLFRSSASLKTIHIEQFQDPITPYPDHTVFLYDSTAAKVKTRPIFRHEIDLWRRKSPFDLVDASSLCQ